PPRPCSPAFTALRSCLALDSKRPGARCLTHVGREGRAGVAALPEHQPVELPRLRRVSVGHEMSVTVERRLNRGVAELRLDVLRVRPLSDQETRISVA